jgi:hypothetical protein
VIDAEREHIDAGGQVLDRPVAGPAEQGVVPGIDEIDFTRKADALEIFHDGAAHRGPLGGAEHGHRAGLQERVEVDGAILLRGCWNAVETPSRVLPGQAGNSHERHGSVFMIWGLTTSTFTLVHVVLSLVGITSGMIVALGLLAGKRLHGWTVLFLITTIATSVTGFGFPVDRLLPSHIVGIVSLAVLAVAIVARYWFRLAGAWRPIYVICAAAALYLNVLVLVVQAFLKVPQLNAVAPRQTEPVFLLAQTIVLIVAIGLTIVAARYFRGDVP